ncbi:hypothetical protein HYH03_004763 [Edaphochlamys debaryana]|uniref:SMP-LTD domain-containing protein n=1 Tax=Edaphochlamys debaryana TaxID=47281 RepID=A0A835Y8P1_9CHLO|nr:hypothetical protein HYH03_004763 [Edaphochlamys debaryana]|eukprot:KAG2497174.1 hypothetical protein HYH03_004763 [Edaphochlamys debaryana]
MLSTTPAAPAPAGPEGGPLPPGPPKPPPAASAASSASSTSTSSPAFAAAPHALHSPHVHPRELAEAPLPAPIRLAGPDSGGDSLSRPTVPHPSLSVLSTGLVQQRQEAAAEHEARAQAAAGQQEFEQQQNLREEELGARAQAQAQRELGQQQQQQLVEGEAAAPAAAAPGAMTPSVGLAQLLEPTALAAPLAAAAASSDPLRAPAANHSSSPSSRDEDPGSKTSTQQHSQGLHPSAHMEPDPAANGGSHPGAAATAAAPSAVAAAAHDPAAADSAAPARAHPGPGPGPGPAQALTTKLRAFLLGPSDASTTDPWGSAGGGGGVFAPGTWRRRALTAAGWAAAALLGGAAALAALLELLLLPLLAVPAAAAAFALAFVGAAVAAAGYRRALERAQRRHALLGLLYSAGAQLPTAPAPAATSSSASATPAAALTPAARAAAAAPGASASTRSLVDDPGLSALRRLLGGALPAWAADAREGERAEWANALLSRAWPSLEGPLRDAIGPALASAAELSKPPFVSSVGLADLSLGDAAPRIEAIRVRPLASALAQAEAVAAVAAAATEGSGGASGLSAPRVTKAVVRDAAAAAAGQLAEPTEAAVQASGSGSAGVVLSGVPEPTAAAVAAAVGVAEEMEVAAAAGRRGGAAAPPAGPADGTAAAAAGGAAKAPAAAAADGGGGLDGVEVELDFEWTGEPTLGLFVEVYLSPGGGTVRLTPRLRELAAAGTLRLALCPLVPHPPGFGAIQGSMPRAPQLAFAFDLGPGPAGALGGLAGPLSAFLQPLVQDAVASALVWPQRVVVPMLPEAQAGPLEALSLRTRGLLAARVLQVRTPPPLAGLRGGASIEVEAYTRADRRVSTPAISTGTTPGLASGSNGGGGGGSGGLAPLTTALWPGGGALLHLPVCEPRSDELRLGLWEWERFNLAELATPNVIAGLRDAWASRHLRAAATLPLAPLAAAPGAAVSAWLPLRRAAEGADSGGDPLRLQGGPGAAAAAAEVEASLAQLRGTQGREGQGRGEPQHAVGAGAAPHAGRVAGRSQLGGGGEARVGEPVVYAAPLPAGAVPAPSPGGPRAPGPGDFGSLLVSLSYLTPDVLSDRLAAELAAAAGAAGVLAAPSGRRRALPMVRGLLLVDVVRGESLLGPQGDAAAALAAAGGGGAALDAYGGGGGGDGSESASEEGMSSDDEEADSSSWSSAGEEDDTELAVAAAAPGGGAASTDLVAAAKIIQSDAPLTFGVPSDPTLGTLHDNAAAARAAGAAADLAPAGAGLTPATVEPQRGAAVAAAVAPASGAIPGIRDRRGRILCDPWIEIQVVRPAASGGGGGGGAVRASSGVTPASVSPSFGLHAEADDVVPAAEGAELRLRVWHRRWFRPDRRLGSASLPLRRLLEAPAPAPGLDAAAGPGPGLGLSPAAAFAPAAGQAIPAATSVSGISNGNGSGSGNGASIAGGGGTGGGGDNVSWRPGQVEQWLRLRGRGARGGQVLVRLKFLPYLDM